MSSLHELVIGDADFQKKYCLVNYLDNHSDNTVRVAGLNLNFMDPTGFSTLAANSKIDSCFMEVNFQGITYIPTFFNIMGFWAPVDDFGWVNGN